MGQVVKVVLRLRSRLEPGVPFPDSTPDFLHDPKSDFPTLWLQTQGHQTQLTAWAGGPKAKDLTILSADELRERAVRAVAQSLGLDENALHREVLESHSYDFNQDPLTRGAYSYVRPGGSHASRKLSLPLADTLFFCGEALDLAYPGTVAGALGNEGLQRGNDIFFVELLARRGRRWRLGSGRRVVRRLCPSRYAHC